MDAADRKRKQSARLGVTVLLAFALFFSAVHAHQAVDGRIAEITEKIEQQPEDAMLFVARGELHRVRQDWKAALEDYLRARELDDEFLLVEFCIGRLKLESGLPAEALPPLDRYLQQVSGDTEALALRGRARAAVGDYLGAVQDLSAALENPPVGRRSPPHLYLERARALVAAGMEHQEEALRGIEQGLVDLGGPVTLELEALELEEGMGRFEAAVVRLDRLAREVKRPEPWLVRKAALLERAGRRDEARRGYLVAQREIAALPEHLRSRGGLVRLDQEVEAGLTRLSGSSTSVDRGSSGV